MLSMCSIRAQAPPPTLVPKPSSFNGFPPQLPARPIAKRPPMPFAPGSQRDLPPGFIPNVDRVAHAFLNPALHTKLSVKIASVSWPVVYLQVVSTQVAKIFQIQKKLFERQENMRLNPGLKVNYVIISRYYSPFWM